MVPKMDVLLHPYDVVLIIWVFSHQKLQKLCFLLSKFMIDLCVPVDFDRDLLARFMIQT